MTSRRNKPYIDSDDNALREPSGWLRSTTVQGVSGSIDREGGDFGGGLIRGTSVITRGEALGHQMWIDREMLQQVRDAINGSTGGMKSRFTHPDMSGDGLGTFLGRHKGAVLSRDEVVRASLHLATSAKDTPDGDLAGYVMDLAAEDSAAFGQSIVFTRDEDAMSDFENKHTVAVQEKDWEGREVTRHRFRSPDPENVNNYPHARLKSLHAVDVVDSPAANPSGMFHSPSIVDDAEKVAAYALGLSQEQPQLMALDVHPQRVRGFVERFLSTHNLKIVRDEEIEEDASMSEKQTTHGPAAHATETTELEIDANKAPAVEAPPPDGDPTTACQSCVTPAILKEHFPTAAAEWRLAQLEAAATLEQATAAYVVELQTQIDALQAANRDLAQRLAAVDRGEETPLSGGVGDDATDERTQRLQSVLGEPLGRYAASLKLNGKN